MADTVDLDEITEYFDTPSELSIKVAQIADMITHAKHMIVFTGAGISTSAKIPDFRGPQGVWTCKARKEKCPDGVPLVQAQPTQCHEFLVTLHRAGKLKYVVSQNIDGLHRRSGIPRDSLSELHGNCFLEVCWQCGADFDRDFEVHGHSRGDGKCKECLDRVPYFCHCTGRKCTQCGGHLKDSIIHFHESLPKEALKRAEKEAKAADLCLVLGTSLRVSPANSIPEITRKRGGNLVIVNLQTTPLDDMANVRVFCRTDELCAALQRQPAVASSLTPRIQLRVGNTCSLLPTATGGNTHRWTVFVETVPNSADVQFGAIDAVTFELHPTFTPNVVSVTQPPFQLTATGWGTFSIPITVSLKGGRRVHIKHGLSFDTESGSNVALVEA